MAQLELLAPRILTDWLPTQAAVQALADLVSGDTRVYLHHRRDLPRAWAQAHDGAPMPLVPPYAFRAWANRDRREAHILVDATETPASVAWVLGHELAHLEVPESNLLVHAFRSGPKPSRYLTSDEAHESHVEEQYANLVGTALLPLFGHQPRSYDRHWWRGRVCALAVDLPGRPMHGCRAA